MGGIDRKFLSKLKWTRSTNIFSFETSFHIVFGWIICRVHIHFRELSIKYIPQLFFIALFAFCQEFSLEVKVYLTFTRFFTEYCTQQFRFSRAWDFFKRSQKWWLISKDQWRIIRGEFNEKWVEVTVKIHHFFDSGFIQVTVIEPCNEIFQFPSIITSSIRVWIYGSLDRRVRYSYNFT